MLAGLSSAGVLSLGDLPTLTDQSRMPLLTPSLIVRYIEASFPGVMAEPSLRSAALEAGHAMLVGPLVAQLDTLDQRHLALVEPDEYSAYIAAVAAMRTALNNWSFGTHHAWQARLVELKAYRRHPIDIVRDVLRACPDDAPAFPTQELTFLGDVGLQEDLRLDLAHATAELSNREFKSSTVLSGSVCEALLYWALRRRKDADLKEAARALGKPALAGTLRRWSLDDFLSVAHHLAIITNTTAKAADAAKDFRNLIHPERASHHGRRCDQATALSALAAALHIARDIEASLVAGGL